MLSDSADCDDGGGEPDLRLIPWCKTNSLPLEPWEVVLVTRMQARRLTSIPPHLWRLCLDPKIAELVDARTQQLQQQLIGP